MKWVLIDLDINKIVAMNGRKYNLLKKLGFTEERCKRLNQGDKFSAKRTKKIPGFVNEHYMAVLFEENIVHHYKLDRQEL